MALMPTVQFNVFEGAFGAGPGDAMKWDNRLDIGLQARWELTRLLSAQLFGVNPSDPLTFATVPVILLGVAVAAAYIPALRATRVDPLVALRHE